MKPIKNILFPLLCVISLTVLLALSCLAAPCLVDEAGLLSGSEADSLETKLESIRANRDMDVIIVTVPSLNGKSSQDFADDYQEEHYAGNGILLLVCLEERDYAFTTMGSAVEAFTDDGLDRLENAFLPYMRVDDFRNAFLAFADESDELIRLYNSGTPYFVKEEKKFPIVKYIIIAAVIGLIFGFSKKKSETSKMKTVNAQSGASNYVIPGSLSLAGANDVFLYANVARTAKESSSTRSSGGHSTTHSSSSGTTHGGRSGKF